MRNACGLKSTSLRVELTMPGRKRVLWLGIKLVTLRASCMTPKALVALIDPQAEGFDAAFARTQVLLQRNQPIFEAGLRAEGALAFADVLLPVKKGGKRAWRMIEVKSSTSVKDYHRDDVAVQAFIARSAGVVLSGVALAHIDSAWVYPGGGNYQGLLIEADLTEEAFGRSETVRGWIAKAQGVVAKRKSPSLATGKHCHEPYDCGFLSHCQSQEPQAEHPIHWLPGTRSKALAKHISENNLSELRDVPDDLLNPRQLRVKTATLKNQPHFDQAGAAQALAAHKLPAYFVDFETIQFAIPRWKGTRPYQLLPFQFSAHRLSRTGKLAQTAFLDLSGNDPAKAFAKGLIAACGERGPVFVYNAGFELARMRELASQLPKLATALHAIIERVVDLLPVARNHCYHPKQQGSWSIKAVLPALCPDLKYGDLDGVQDGGTAMSSYLEAISPATTVERKAEIERQLLAYCALDTYAMVRIWSVFTGKQFSQSVGDMT